MAAAASSAAIAATNAANAVYRWWWPSANIGPPEYIKIYLADGSVNPWHRDLYGCVGYFANQVNATNIEFKLASSKWQFLNKNILGHIEMILTKVVSAQDKVRSLPEAAFFAVALASHQLIIPSLKDACRQHMVEVLLMAPNAEAIRLRMGMPATPDWTDSDVKSVEADNAWEIEWPHVPPLNQIPGGPHLPVPGGRAMNGVPLPPSSSEGMHGNGHDGLEGIVHRPIEHPDADAHHPMVLEEVKSPAIGASFLLPDGVRHDAHATVPISLPLSALPGVVTTQPLSKEQLTASSDSLDSDDGDMGDVDAHSPLSFSVNLAATRKPIIPPPVIPAVTPSVIPSSDGMVVVTPHVPETPAAAVMPIIPRTFGISRQRAAFFSADDTTDVCTLCQLAFTTLRRRHHCRHCGRLIDDACSRSVPDLDNEDQINSLGLHWTSGWVTLLWALSSSERRVCKDCYTKLTVRDHCYTRAMESLALPIPLLERATTVNGEWRRSAAHCLSALYEIQYNRPTQGLTATERAILWANRYYFVGHSRWMVRLMKAVDWQDETCSKDTINLLRSTQRHIENCNQVFCTRLCRPHIPAGDALELLSQRITNAEVRLFAIECLKRADLAELAGYLPTLVNYMKHEQSSAMVRSPLCDFLIETALRPMTKAAAVAATMPTSAAITPPAVMIPSSIPLSLSISPVPSMTSPTVLLSPVGSGVEGVTSLTPSPSSLSPSPLSHIHSPSTPSLHHHRLPSSTTSLSIGIPTSLSAPTTVAPPSSHSRPATPITTPSSSSAPSVTTVDSNGGVTLIDAHLRFTTDLYWMLSVAAESKTHKRDYDHVKERLVRELTAADPLLALQLSDGQDFVARFERTPVGDIAGLCASLKSVQLPLRLPVDPSVRVIKMDLDNVIEFTSATKPVMVPCTRDLSKMDYASAMTTTTTTCTPDCVTVTPTIAAPPSAASVAGMASPSPSPAPRSPSITPRTLSSTPPPLSSPASIDVLGDAAAVAHVASLMSPSTNKHEAKGHVHHPHHGHHHHHHTRVASLASKRVAKPSVAPASLYRVIYKREDVRKDQIILNVIRMMDMILKREAGLDLLAVTYRVTPTSSDGGFIETVLNCATVSDIRGPAQRTLLGNWLAQFENDLGVIHRNFSRSMAFWTVVQLLLGLGDRHLDNIMLTQDGRLFHIDFGFVLGREPKPMMPRIRLDTFMIDTMGGESGVHYSNYLDMCIRAFLCLRQHMSLFYQMLLALPEADPPIKDLNFTKEYLEKELSQRFLPGYSDAEARDTLSMWTTAKYDTYAHALNDKFRMMKRHVVQSYLPSILPSFLGGTTPASSSSSPAATPSSTSSPSVPTSTLSTS